MDKNVEGEPMKLRIVKNQLLAIEFQGSYCCDAKVFSDPKKVIELHGEIKKTKDRLSSSLVDFKNGTNPITTMVTEDSEILFGNIQERRYRNVSFNRLSREESQIMKEMNIENVTERLPSKYGEMLVKHNEVEEMIHKNGQTDIVTNTYNSMFRRYTAKILDNLGNGYWLLIEWLAFLTMFTDNDINNYLLSGGTDIKSFKDEIPQKANHQLPEYESSLMKVQRENEELKRKLLELTQRKDKRVEETTWTRLGEDAVVKAKEVKEIKEVKKMSREVQVTGVILTRNLTYMKMSMKGEPSINEEQQLRKVINYHNETFAGKDHDPNNVQYKAQKEKRDKMFANLRALVSYIEMC